MNLCNIHSDSKKEVTKRQNEQHKNKRIHNEMMKKHEKILNFHSIIEKTDNKMASSSQSSR